MSDEYDAMDPWQQFGVTVMGAIAGLYTLQLEAGNPPVPPAFARFEAVLNRAISELHAELTPSQHDADVIQFPGTSVFQAGDGQREPTDQAMRIDPYDMGMEPYEPSPYDGTYSED